MTTFTTEDREEAMRALVSAGRETKMPIKSEFWHILQKHIALRKAGK